jgi:hypothetical protein
VMKSTHCTQSSQRIDAESKSFRQEKDAVTFFRRNCEARSNLCNLYSSIDLLSTFISLTSMSLRDLACYTLTLKPHEKDPKVTELVSVENGREEHRFARVREVKDGEAYSSSIYGMSSLQSSRERYQRGIVMVRLGATNGRCSYWR